MAWTVGRILLVCYLSCMLLAVLWIYSSCDLQSSTSRGEYDWMNMQNMMGELKQQEAELSKLKAALENQERGLRQAAVKLKLAYGSDSLSHLNFMNDDIPTIYAITPTYARCEQKAELTRLKQTFLHIPKFHWIVVEDSANKTELVSSFLEKSGLTYTHLNVMTPAAYKMTEKDPNWLKPRGVLQRNLALQWIRTNLNANTARGVVYFADDDNTYDLKIFEEMRHTQKVSVWPVGLVGKLRYESPIVEEGKVVGWFTYWKPERPFAMDMAGFAVNVKVLLENPHAEFRLRVKRGYQESELLHQIVTLDELEPLADHCKKVLVWHTRTEKADLRNEEKLRKAGKQSDLNIEV